MTEYTVKVSKEGTNKWYYKGKLHRLGGLPAIEFISGTKHWYYKGKLHRDGDLPATEDVAGNKSWFINGKCHRDNDLPAIEWADGDKWWYVNDELHRLGGLPAIEKSNGDKEWFVNGKRNRDNGLPVIEYADGSKQWYVNGKMQYYNNLHRNDHTVFKGTNTVSGRDVDWAWYRDNIKQYTISSNKNITESIESDKSFSSKSIVNDKHHHNSSLLQIEKINDAPCHNISSKSNDIVQGSEKSHDELWSQAEIEVIYAMSIKNKDSNNIAKDSLTNKVILHEKQEILISQTVVKNINSHNHIISDKAKSKENKDIKTVRTNKVLSINNYGPVNKDIKEPVNAPIIMKVVKEDIKKLTGVKLLISQIEKKLS